MHCFWILKVQQQLKVEANLNCAEVYRPQSCSWAANIQISGITSAMPHSWFQAQGDMTLCKYELHDVARGIYTTEISELPAVGLLNRLCMRILKLYFLCL